MSRGADEFAEYVLSRLPASPARILEVGCGEDGGVTPALAAAGHDVVAIDPRAPEGPPYHRVSLEEFEDDRGFDVCVAGRVLHHLDPLGAAVDRLVALAPVLVVDDFAHDRIDEATSDWYRAEFEQLAAAGAPPKAPRSLEEWRAAHPGLHSYAVMKEALDARYDAIDLRWEPYLYRWLTGPTTKAREEALIDDGALQAIGFRYAGRVRR